MFEVFARAAHAAGGAPAVSDESETIAYRELHRRALAVAGALRASGLRPNDPVLVACARGSSMVCGMLAAAAAGATYVPVDPELPTTRLRTTNEAAGAELAVCDEQGAASLAGLDVTPVAIDDAARGPATDLSHDGPRTACLFFTSGSTGAPKGVEVSTASLVAFLSGAARVFAPGRGQTWSCVHAFTFDFSIFETWLPLAKGAHVAVLPPVALVDPLALSERLRRFGVTHLSLTPTALAHCATTIAPRLDDLALGTLFVGGERLDFATLAAIEPPLRDDRLRAWNLYGPTEATVFATARRITAHDVVHERRSLIGRALPHVSVGVRRDDGTPCADGEEGEIVIDGPGVADGYRGDPRLTSERFAVSADGSRSYLTGDRGRTVGADLEFLGRHGGFVKIRGYRVEPGDVAAAFRAHPDVEDAVVVLVESAALARGPVLAAGVRARAGAAVATRELREFVAERLPAYMRPTWVALLPALPTLPSGKTDRDRARQLILDSLGRTDVA